MTDQPLDTCCQQFANALEVGTDNEGYSALIRCGWDRYHIGCELDPLSYCPWCGKRLDGKEDDTRSNIDKLLRQVVTEGISVGSLRAMGAIQAAVAKTIETLEGVQDAEELADLLKLLREATDDGTD